MQVDISFLAMQFKIMKPRINCSSSCARNRT